MRRLRYFLIAFAAAAAGFSTPSLADGFAVPMDQVRMVTFDQPVATVYVGNPAIADVTVIDSRRVFILGKAFGATNVIALDAKGEQVVDKPLTVYGTSANVVTLNRGANQVTYACAAARCETSPLPGDSTAAFQAVMGEVTQHQDMGQKAAVASASQ